MLGTKDQRKGERGQRRAIPRSAFALPVRWAGLPHRGCEESCSVTGLPSCTLLAGIAGHTGQPEK